VALVAVQNSGVSVDTAVADEKGDGVPGTPGGTVAFGLRISKLSNVADGSNAVFQSSPCRVDDISDVEEAATT
jgi:hypothetical protein